jgi:hypothetical protein
MANRNALLPALVFWMLVALGMTAGGCDWLEHLHDGPSVPDPFTGPYAGTFVPAAGELGMLTFHVESNGRITGTITRAGASYAARGPARLTPAGAAEVEFWAVPGPGERFTGVLLADADAVRTEGGWAVCPPCARQEPPCLAPCVVGSWSAQKQGWG